MSETSQLKDAKAAEALAILEDSWGYYMPEDVIVKEVNDHAEYADYYSEAA